MIDKINLAESFKMLYNVIIIRYSKVIKMQLDRIKLNQSSNSLSDFLLLKKIHKIVMKNAVINSIGHWDDSFQEKRLKTIFESNWHTLYFLYYDRELIGTINLIYEDDHLSVKQLYLLQNYQKKGIGSYLLKTYGNNMEIRLSVLKNDIGANEFYKKNGFIKFEEDQYQNYLRKLSSKTAQNHA